jgi:hypothetical protein
LDGASLYELIDGKLYSQRFDLWILAALI